MLSVLYGLYMSTKLAFFFLMLFHLQLSPNHSTTLFQSKPLLLLLSTNHLTPPFPPKLNHSLKSLILPLPLSPTHRLHPLLLLPPLWALYQHPYHHCCQPFRSSLFLCPSQSLRRDQQHSPDHKPAPIGWTPYDFGLIHHPDHGRSPNLLLDMVLWVECVEDIAP